MNAFLQYLVRGIGLMASMGLFLLTVVDLFLLGFSVLIALVGIYELFVGALLNLPGWLRMEDLESLKGVLVKTVIVVLTISFMGRAVTWDGEENLLAYGIAVVAALSFFLSLKSESGEKASVLSLEVTETLRRQAQARSEQARNVFERSIDVREAIFLVFSALARGSSPPDSDLEALNAALRESATHHVLRFSSTEAEAQAEAHDQTAVSWSWAPEDHLARPLWPIVQSAAELLTTADVRRIKMCEGRDCTWLFLDESRNRSRRWCDMQTCGNRAKARRYRAKDES